MREYASISPHFWIGDTGKSLRGNPAAQVLALYLMSSPHSNMIGVFHCPILYMAHETGLSIEGASKALASLIDGAFCEYEESSETVFVIRMAAFQVGERIKPGDKRGLGVQRAYENITSPSVRARFFKVYGLPHRLSECKPLASPLQAHPKQLTGTGAGTGAVVPQDPDAPAPPPAPPTTRGSRLPDDWVLPDEWKTWAQANRPDLDVDLTADAFRDFWISKAGKDAAKLDWQATWRNWVRGQKAYSGGGFRQPTTNNLLAGAI